MMPLYNNANVSFEQPLELLSACHQKILRQCVTLEKMLVHQLQHGCDEQLQQAATAVLRYFEHSGMKHHQDEEENLFPTLLASSDDKLLHVAIDRLRAQHVDMIAGWEALRDVLTPLSQGQQIELPEKLIHHFVLIYRQHIAIEDSELFPLAAEILNAEQQKQLGLAMVERRKTSH